MKDPELNEDKGLEPYQGELFDNPESGRYMKFIPVKTRGEAKKEKSPTPYTKPKFQKVKDHPIRIDLIN